MLPDSEEPIITDTQQVINTLNSLTKEMDSRYNLLKSAQVRNIKEYNEKFIARKLNPQKGHRYMPYIIVIVDEFADLIMTAGREIEMPLARLAQLARAIGIHLVIATQRPSINIITGAIKANFPVRLAFKVTSMMDSRTILDSPGANQLVGRGDMLITSGSDLIRLQCAFIDTSEIEIITDYIATQQAYPTAFLLPEYSDETRDDTEFIDPNSRDELFEKAARLVVEFQQGSTSLIQRKFSIGYNRAGRIVDQLEAAGILGPYEGSKARQVMIKDLLSLEQFLENNIHD
jgi:S-DNA-T family DNA segregation ATPase FtsK/SpoIIIE